MTHKEYMKELDAILRRYAKIAKNWQMSSGDMQTAIQKEKGEAIDALRRYYEENKT